MKKREANVKSEFEQDIEQRAKQIHERYGKKGLISKKILERKLFDELSNY